MILKVKGKSFNISEPIVGRVTRNPYSTLNDQIFLFEDNGYPNRENDYKAILFNEPIDLKDIPYVCSIPTFDHLNENDIIAINTDGVINTLYRVNSNHNFIFTTDRCNSNCLMCSQPPKNVNDIEYHFDINKQMISLVPKDCYEIGITGGEPTLMGNLFFEMLSHINTELPETEVHCLTNGRAFAWENFAKKLGDLKYDRLMLGIPVYSDYYLIHDYVVQAQGAWHQTIEGLYNLAQNNVRIEVRVVLHKITIPRLVNLARYISKNLPFVEHVALMGLEYQGYTPFNIEKLWIDPYDYMKELRTAANLMSEFGLNISIYNSQLCLMPKEIWDYNRKSISDWKNVYLEECQKCDLIDECGGLFQSNLKKHSIHIRALKKEDFILKR